MVVFPCEHTFACMACSCRVPSRFLVVCERPNSKDATAVVRRYCTAVLSPALHNVLETSCKEDSEFSLKGLEKGFRAYKEVGTWPRCLLVGCRRLLSGFLPLRQRTTHSKEKRCPKPWFE